MISWLLSGSPARLSSSNLGHKVALSGLIHSPHHWDSQYTLHPMIWFHHRQGFWPCYENVNRTNMRSEFLSRRKIKKTSKDLYCGSCFPILWKPLSSHLLGKPISAVKANSPLLGAYTLATEHGWRNTLTRSSLTLNFSLKSLSWLSLLPGVHSLLPQFIHSPTFLFPNFSSLFIVQTSLSQLITL